MNVESGRITLEEFKEAVTILVALATFPDNAIHVSDIIEVFGRAIASASIVKYLTDPDAPKFVKENTK